MNKENREKRSRVYKELSAAGMTSYGFIKMETLYLPKIIHDNEQIHGVVYGKTVKDKIGSAMLVATNRRIIFLDCKPLYTTSDEVSYDVVSGVKMNVAGLFAGVTLHTRVRDYGLRFVNMKCARNFVEYIEQHIEMGGNGEGSKKTTNEVWKSTIREAKHEEKTQIIDNSTSLLRSQDTAVLSTVDSRGNPHGSIIHYVVGKDDIIYFVTQKDTNKSQNIASHGQVALTVHKPGSLKTLQISGIATEEDDNAIASTVFNQVVSVKKYAEGKKLPPVAGMKKGEYIVIKITPTNMRYQDFNATSW